MNKPPLRTSLQPRCIFGKRSHFTRPHLRFGTNHYVRYLSPEPGRLSNELVVFTIEESCRIEIGEVIQRNRAMGILKDVDPHTLDLWKVSAIDDDVK